MPDFSFCIEISVGVVIGVLSLLRGKLGFYDTYSDPTGYTGYSFDFACIKLLHKTVDYVDYCFGKKSKYGSTS